MGTREEPQGWVSGAAVHTFTPRGLSWLAWALGGSSRGKMWGERPLGPPAHSGDAFLPLRFAVSCAAAPLWSALATCPWGRGIVRLQPG